MVYLALRDYERLSCGLVVALCVGKELVAYGAFIVCMYAAGFVGCRNLGVRSHLMFYLVDYGFSADFLVALGTENYLDMAACRCASSRHFVFSDNCTGYMNMNRSGEVCGRSLIIQIQRLNNILKLSVVRAVVQDVIAVVHRAESDSSAFSSGRNGNFEIIIQIPCVDVSDTDDLIIVLFLCLVLIITVKCQLFVACKVQRECGL